MHFLIVFALISCFFIFPGFRKVIAYLLTLGAFGFAILYFPYLLIEGKSIGYKNFFTWLFYMIVSIGFYTYLYAKKNGIDFNPNLRSENLKKLDNTFELVSTIIESSSWNQAIDEFEGENRNRGLYAKVFAESQGNEAKTKAKYIEIRAREIQNSIPTEKFTPEQININPNNLNDVNSSNKYDKINSNQRYYALIPVGLIVILFLIINFIYNNP